MTKHVKLYKAKQSLAIECRSYYRLQLPQFRDCMTYSALIPMHNMLRKIYSDKQTSAHHTRLGLWPHAEVFIWASQSQHICLLWLAKINKFRLFCYRVAYIHSGEIKIFTKYVCMYSASVIRVNLSHGSRHNSLYSYWSLLACSAGERG